MTHKDLQVVEGLTDHGSDQSELIGAEQMLVDTFTWDLGLPAHVERYAVQHALDYYARRGGWVRSAEKTMRFGADLVVRVDDEEPFHVEVKGTTRGLTAIKNRLEPSQVAAAKEHLDDGRWKLFVCYEISGRDCRMLELEARAALDLHFGRPVGTDEHGDSGEPITSPGRAFLLTWNPLRWPWDGYNDWVEATTSGSQSSNWSSGGRKSGILPGDTLYLLRQGPDPRGLIGRGVATSEIYLESHFTDPSRSANYVDLEFDVLLHDDEILLIHQLQASVPDVNWTPMSSGNTLGSSSELVAGLFESHVTRLRRSPL